MGYMESLQVPVPMSRAMKCQLRKICLEGGDMESEWKDSTEVTMFTTSHVLNHAMFT